MSDEDGKQGEGQDPEPTGQDPSNGGREGAGSGGQGSPEVFSRDYVESLRREAAGYRTELKDVKAKLESIEEADLSEREKLQKQLDKAQEARETAETALRQERARLAIVQAATKHGIPTDLALKLVDVEFDDEGNPVDVEKAVKAVAEEYPQLVAEANGGGSPTNPARQKKTSLTREDVKGMTSDEINERWDEVQEVLAS